MESIEHVPVVPFPGPRSMRTLLKSRQEKQRQRYLVHFVFVVFHALKAYQTCWPASRGHRLSSPKTISTAQDVTIASTYRSATVRHQGTLHSETDTLATDRLKADHTAIL
jgi:hypothetical protein